MSKFQIVKGIIDNLEETPYTEGKVYFTYDNVESQNITIYADIDGVRRKIKEGVQRDELNNYLLKTDIANWAKASAKPTYTASEVGALSISHPAANITTEQITQWNNKSNFSGSYNDLTEKPPIPTRTSDLTNDSNYVKNTYVADLDNPSANMYNEIIAAYNAGRNIIGEYQNKVILLPFIGIGESSVQFGLEVNQQSFLLTLNSDGTLDTNNNNFTIPTKTSDLTNDSGFLTEETDPTVPAWAKTANKPTYTAKEVGAVPFNASQAMATLKGNPSTLRFASTNTANQYVQAYVDTNSASITLQNQYGSGYPIVSNVKLKGIASPQDSKDAANKQYVDNAVSDKMTSTAVNSAIATAIGNINQFNVAIVSTLPTENIDNHTIYFMSNGGSNNDIYDEWMYINNNWEKIGATSIDLSGYMQTSHPANGITSADITNWNSKSDTDELVKQEYNNSSSNYPVLLSPQYQDTTITSSVYKNTNVYVSPREGFLHADKLQVGTVAQSGYISLGKNRFYGTNNGTDSYTITLPTASGTVALTSDIPTVPTKVSDLTNDSGFISSYTETDPVFSASVAAGITSTDISNWNAKVSDTGKWNGVALGSGRLDDISDLWIPSKGNTNNSGTAYWIKTTQELPTESAAETVQIPRYKKINNQWYLQSTTPLANDNSTKVATTEYVNNYVKKSGDTMTGNLTFSSGHYIVENDNIIFSIKKKENTLLNIPERTISLNINGQKGSGDSAITRIGFSISPSSQTQQVYLTGIITPTDSSESYNYYAASKGYVDSKIPKVYSSTNTTGYLTMDTLPIYNGTVV